jgi:hypothetical protein
MCVTENLNIDSRPNENNGPSFELSVLVTTTTTLQHNHQQAMLLHHRHTFCAPSSGTFMIAFLTSFIASTYDIKRTQHSHFTRRKQYGRLLW